MEITIKLKQNDYTSPTECRQEVVQAICDAFLSDNIWTDFCPHSSGPYRPATLLVLRHKNGQAYGFHGRQFTDEGEPYRVRGCEMCVAIECLIKAGYHIFTFYKYNDPRYKAYRVSKKNFLEGRQDAREVFRFEDTID